MTQETRRRALKGLAITVPAAWTAPIVNSVILPAHAQMSPISATIDCTVEDVEGFCQPSAIEFRVFGTVGGDDLEGAVLEIEYTNDLIGGGTDTHTTTTLVQSDNSFDETVVATPPSGEGWGGPAGDVTVRFLDQATFGDAECMGTHNCEESVLD